MKKLSYISVIALFFSFFVSCKKDKVITSPSARLTFSQDSILFDTVFTKIGSTTKLFRIHNRNNGKLNITSLKLARGNASFFRLNVDGLPGKSFTNLEIAANDSMYIFVEVTINPTFDPSISPFIYKDSILFEINGGQQHFDLIAFGQNAYYHMPNQKIIFSNTQALYYGVEPCNATWATDKPHLIYGYAVVDSACTLTIPAGTKVYLHDGAGIWVYRYGTIRIGADGTPTKLVTFQGDRLEQEYKDVPGQWDRIWINEGSMHNLINYAVIKNAYIGVHAGYAALDGLGIAYTPGTPSAKLILTNTIIQNCSYDGILGHSYNITGGNDVVVNCGQHILEFTYGGNYAFYQCTFANYWAQTNNSSSSSSRTTPSFAFNNYFNGNMQSVFDSLYFGNCILDGTLAEEFQFDILAVPLPGFGIWKFEHCALKTSMSFGTHANTPVIITATANLMRFVSPSTYNFDLSPGPPYSAAYQSGISSANGGYTTDIKGVSPTSSNPNMGAYQQ